jgi:hypothetical protein
MIFLVFLLYPKVSSTVISLYGCKEVHGVSYLRADFRVLCGDNTWTKFAIGSVPFLIAHPIGMPIVLYLFLWNRRNRLHHAESLVSFGMLYHAFDADNWFFEILDMIHKLLLTGVIQLLPQEMQIRVAIVICTLYLMLLLVRSPYRNAGYENVHHSQNLLLILFFAGFLARERVERGESMELVLGILFIVQSIVLGSYVSRQLGQGVLELLRENKKTSGALQLTFPSSASPMGGRAVHNLGFQRRDHEDLVMSRNPMLA